MVRIHVLVDERGRLAGFTASGHALFADPGQDIVCAAVSALLQTTVLGLEQSARVNPQWKIQKGRLHCEVPPAGREAEGARVLMESVLSGLRQIAGQHPEYLSIEEKLLRSRARRR